MRWILCAPPDHATSQPHRTAGSTGPEPEVEVTHQDHKGGRPDIAAIERAAEHRHR
jgi:hypothetical protein